MIDTLRLSMILLIGYGVLFGLITPKTAGKKLVMMIVTPVALLLARNAFMQAWGEATHLQQAGLVCAAVVLGGMAVMICRTEFGHHVLVHVVGEILCNSLRAVGRMPFKLWRAIFRRP